MVNFGLSCRHCGGRARLDSVRLDGALLHFGYCPNCGSYGPARAARWRARLAWEVMA